MPLRIPTHEPPVSPGEMLAEEFMKPLGLTQAELAEKLHIDRPALNAIIRGRRAVTPRMALRLAKVFGTSPDFWMNGQMTLDLYNAEHDEHEIAEIRSIESVGRD